MNTAQQEILKRLGRGQLLTRAQVRASGAANPASAIRALRKQGHVVIYVQGFGDPFWVAPELAAANGVDWTKRMLAKKRQAP